MKIKNILIFTIILLGFLVRVLWLPQFPSGLNADEAAIGYNAWSLINTGRDEHGASWPLVFRSFDDYKPPVYFYLSLPFVYLLDLTVLAVRLPSAILGTISIWLVYQLSRRLFKKSFYPSLIATLVFATSPWAIHFSRGGWEVNAALFFVLLGIYGFLKSLSNPKYLYLFVFSFALSLYTYHSARLISPVLALALVIIYRSKLLGNNLVWKSSRVKNIIISFTLGIIICIPLATQMLSKEGQSRFTGVSVFSDTGPLWQALEYRRAHGESLYTRLIHNQYLSYGLRFTKNYLTHYSPRFLFVDGDEIARSKVPGMGQFYIILAPFYLFGIYFLLQAKNKFARFILVWFMVAPLAASLTFQSPHALRSQNLVVPASLVIAFGFWGVIKNLKSKIAPIMVFTLAILYFFAIYLHQYFYVYPRTLPYAWQYGFDHIADFVKQNGQKYQKIIITDRYDQPYILMAFYLRIPPEKMQNEIVMTPRDKFGFSTVRKLDKFEFRAINWSEDKNSQNTLIISADEPVDEGAVIDTIKDPAGNTMYKILSTNVK